MRRLLGGKLDRRVVDVVAGSSGRAGRPSTTWPSPSRSSRFQRCSPSAERRASSTAVEEELFRVTRVARRSARGARGPDRRTRVDPRAPRRLLGLILGGRRRRRHGARSPARAPRGRAAPARRDARARGRPSRRCATGWSRRCTSAHRATAGAARPARPRSSSRPTARRSSSTDVDPDVLGGLRIQVGAEVVDAHRPVPARRGPTPLAG